MVRTLLTMLLLVAVTQAQVITFAELSGAVAPLSVYASPELQYDLLRQGTAEYGLITLGSSGRFAIGDPRGKDSRITATKLEISSTQGLQVSPVNYPATQQKQFNFERKSFKVLAQTHDNPIRFRFKVRAAHDLVPGDYALQGRLTYQLINDSGISEPRQLAIEIPIKVGNHHATVKTVDRSVAGIRGITPAEWIEIVLLAPISIPLGIFMALIGWDGC